MFSALAAINSTDITINDIKNALPEGVSLPPELENVEIPKVEEGLKLFKDKCVKVSGSDAAYDEATVSDALMNNFMQISIVILNF